MGWARAHVCESADWNWTACVYLDGGERCFPNAARKVAFARGPGKRTDPASREFDLADIPPLAGTIPRCRLLAEVRSDQAVGLTARDAMHDDSQANRNGFELSNRHRFIGAGVRGRRLSAGGARGAIDRARQMQVEPNRDGDADPSTRNPGRTRRDVVPAPASAAQDDDAVERPADAVGAVDAVEADLGPVAGVLGRHLGKQAALRDAGRHLRGRSSVDRIPSTAGREPASDGHGWRDQPKCDRQDDGQTSHREACVSGTSPPYRALTAAADQRRGEGTTTTVVFIRCQRDSRVRGRIVPRRCQHQHRRDVRAPAHGDRRSGPSLGNPVRRQPGRLGALSFDRRSTGSSWTSNRGPGHSRAAHS
jgi:hypothetical protein